LSANLSVNLSGNLSSALSVGEWGVNDANLSVNECCQVVTDKSGFWKILWDLPWLLLFEKFCFQQTGRGFQNVVKNNFSWVSKGWLVFRCFILVGFQRWFSFSDYLKFYCFTHNIFYLENLKLQKGKKRRKTYKNFQHFICSTDHLVQTNLQNFLIKKNFKVFFNQFQQIGRWFTIDSRIIWSHFVSKNQ